ncbi:MAG: translocation/assembly module TamB domain-containing protein [Desulfobacca sp.]|uniref:translocation/assembly module TamB domain-containing protein n=1 Tax=Desulfobacca sp. TaxID=2067990 RepID=UPI0040499100
MTATARSRFWLKIGLSLGLAAALLLLGGWCFTTAAFWERVGWRLVAEVQDRLHADLTVRQVSGDLLTGMVFHDVSLQRAGETILTLRELEVSVSLLSFLKLQPVIRTLIFREPILSLQENRAGQWNIAGLLKKRPPPPFSRLHLEHIEVQDGTVRLARPERHHTVQALDIRLGLTIQDPGRPQVRILVHEGRIGFQLPPYPAVRLQLTGSGSAQELLLQEGELWLADLPAVAIQGAITALATEPHLAVTVHLPEVTGQQLQQLWPAWPAALSGRADLTVTGPLSALEVRAVGALHDCQWQAQGSWQRQSEAASRFQLEVSFDHLKPVVLPLLGGAAAHLQELSPLSGSLTITGSGQPWRPETLTAGLHLGAWTLRQAKVQTTTVTLALAKGEQSFQLLGQGNFGRLEAAARGRWWSGPGTRTAIAGEVRLATVGLNPEVLLAALGSKAPPGALDLTFTGQVQAPSPSAWRQATVSGTLQAKGRLQDQWVQEVFLQGSWAGGELRFAPARLRLGSLAATAQGRLSATAVDAKLSLSLAGPGPWPLLPIPVKGQGQIAGTVQGPWSALTYQLSFQGQGLAWQNLRLQAVHGQVAGRASQESWQIASFALEAQGLATAVGRFGRIAGSGRTQEGNLVFELKAQDSPGYGGELAGVAAWDQHEVQIRCNRLQWGPPAMQVAATEAATLTIGPGRVAITPLRLRYRQTSLMVAGKVTADDLAGQIRVENLQLAELTDLVPQLSLVQGALQARVDFSGSGRSPIMRAEVQVSPGAIGTFRFDVFQAGFAYQENLLRLHGQLLEKPDRGRLTWQGTAPLTVTVLPWSWRIPEQGLQLRVWTENLTMALLPQLIPPLADATGPLELQAQVSGSLRQPWLAGTLRYGPGSLIIRESGAPLSLEPGEIRLEGDRLIIGRLACRSGEGSADITGGAKLAGLRLADVHLTLKATDLLAIRRAGSWAVANGQASLTGTWPNFQLAGQLTVSPGQFRLAFFRAERNPEIIILPRVCRLPDPRTAATGTAAVVRNFAMDLGVDIPGAVWLRDKEANVEIQGQINVRRRPPGPKYLAGWVKAKEGTFAINNKIFTVDKAMLIFPGAPHKPIRVEARASRQVEDYTLTVFAVGPTDSLRTGLESNPPLPPRDQLSLLLFDHLADKMTREEYITASQRAVGLLGSLTAQQLKSFLGDKLPLLGEVAPTTSQEGVGVGKKIGRGLTVSYERKLNPVEGEDVDQVRLNYKLYKYFSVETQLGRKNPGGDLFFDIDF